MSISDFVRDASRWMQEEGPHSDIVISTRIRIARNLRDIPFPLLANEAQSEEVLNAVRQAVESPAFAEKGRYEILPLRDVEDVDRQALVEKYLISPSLVEHARRGAVVLRDDEEVSIMVNEEDHLRLQVLLPGLQLREAWALANETDDLLEARLNYAFDDRYGYLTACPTNVGTGIRASVMLHLPALVVTQQINRVLSALGQVGLVVRGVYGEGTEAVGNLFQISNQITLGQSEEEIILNLDSVVRKIIEHEQSARHFLLNENREVIEDRIARSFGILAYARRLDSKETMQRLSDVRLGIDLGVIKGVSKNILKELMVMTQPGFLQKFHGAELAPGERDWRRASLVRERLQMDEGRI
ncbi:protein arginine kinase [Tumebacillus flagellatus]|uniref:Protein-arginine kinase n=1 Tax=Tumebacillus flagellatus TaxID=1157490 RepID=A0A074LPE4_9BACL|nr:protein arginine kinase [Tumebacillus flagellatus]KEO81698.1 ATP:guanido phosphotransferase [Tumebacillus flagellatus]